MKRLLGALLMAFVVGAGAVQADSTLTAFDFRDAAEEQRYKDLIEEIRCLVCQNQSLLDSDAELAHDLRREVFDLMRQGKDDGEVISFLVTRYGDFVLYKPPLKPSTYPLWFGPFLLLAIAAAILFRALRRRAQVAEPEFTDEQEQQLKRILEQDDGGDSKQS